MATNKSDNAEAENAEGIPTLEELWGLPCENCTVGVLLVTLYDPDSTHEAGQDLSADNQHESGGRYETQCFACGQRLSHPLAAFVDDEGAE